MNLSRWRNRGILIVTIVATILLSAFLTIIAYIVGAQNQLLEQWCPNDLLWIKEREHLLVNNKYFDLSLNTEAENVHIFSVYPLVCSIPSFLLQSSRVGRGNDADNPVLAAFKNEIRKLPLLESVLEFGNPRWLTNIRNQRENHIKYYRRIRFCREDGCFGIVSISKKTDHNFALVQFSNCSQNAWMEVHIDVTEEVDVSELEQLCRFLAATIHIHDHFNLMLSPSSFDFGERTEIERPVLTATLRNDGERTVHVTDVIRTCVCANLELSTTNLPPGGSAEVRCTLDPNVFSGPFLKTFFIKTDDPATPSITVPIRGSVRQLWEVSPDKWHQMRAGETNAVLRVKAAPDALALVRTEILGPAGASFELRPAGEREFDAVFAPGDQPRGQHHWTVNLYPEGAETPALGLHLGAQIGERWKCVPARLRAPVDGRDFVADLLVKPADGKDLPADVDPAAITISPEWDHVAIEPLGPPTWRGIPLRLTVGTEMVSSWEFPKTFYLTIPNHGAASVYFEKIVLPSDADNR